MQVRRLEMADRAQWHELWQGYLDYYEHRLPVDVTDATWARLVGDDADVIGLAAADGGRLLGICHLVVHPSTWTTTSYCYLEDLFVRPDVRSGGVGRSLVAAARAEASAAGSSKLYWQTHATNTTARRLYDDVADHRGFIVYEIGL